MSLNPTDSNKRIHLRKFGAKIKHQKLDKHKLIVKFD